MFVNTTIYPITLPEDGWDQVPRGGNRWTNDERGDRKYHFTFDRTVCNSKQEDGVDHMSWPQWTRSRTDDDRGVWRDSKPTLRWVGWTTQTGRQKWRHGQTGSVTLGETVLGVRVRVQRRFRSEVVWPDPQSRTRNPTPSSLVATELNRLLGGHGFGSTLFILVHRNKTRGREKRKED